MFKKMLAIFAIIVAILAIKQYIKYSQTDTQPTKTPDQIITEQPGPKDDLIKVGSPKTNQVITSPLIITGQARGTWFFEGQFPVKLIDGQGVIIATGIATTQDEWMTENFVPFTATLTFQKPSTGSGTLILEKDNPSGIPENTDQLKIPIRF